MRNVIAAVLLLACASVAHAEPCQTTVSQLIISSGQSDIQLFQMKKDGLKKLLAFMNGNRAKLSKEPFEADTFIAGHFKAGGVPQVGIALANGECVVPGTSFVIDPALFVQILISAGLSADDLEPFKGGVKS